MKMRDTLYPRICKINDSTNVVEVAFDPLDREMVVTFKDNIKYFYPNISSLTFGQIISSESVGKNLNSFIKNNNIKAVRIHE